MAEKRNILFILPWLPYPLKSGGHQAIFNGIKAAVNDYNVFITYDENDNYNSSIEQAELIKTLDHSVKIIPYKKKYQATPKSIIFRCYCIFWNLKEKIKRNLGLVDKTFNPSFFQINITDNKRIAYINNIIEKYKIDIVQCEMMSRISDVLILPPSVKKIFVHHQIGFVRNKLDLLDHKLFAQYQEQHLLSKEIEIFLLNHYDSIIALSDYDKNEMEENGVVIPIYVSPAIITTKSKPFLSEPKQKKLSFIGPSSHNPNVRGMLWFLEKCWKELTDRDDKYELQIIGEWEDAEKKLIKKFSPNIQFCGYVPNIENQLKNTIMIVPIHIGSGIRMKILEAISLGIPVVSTVIGAQGLPLKDQIDCFITDNEHTFVEDILKLRDESLQKKMVQNAQERIIVKYSFESFKKTRLSIYNSIKN